jgi:hypothetical protein
MTWTERYENDYGRLVHAICSGAEAAETPVVREKLTQLCARLGPLGRKLEDREVELERVARRLEDIERSWASCDIAGGADACKPFFERIKRVMEECRRL